MQSYLATVDKAVKKVFRWMAAYYKLPVSYYKLATSHPFSHQNSKVDLTNRQPMGGEMRLEPPPPSLQGPLVVTSTACVTSAVHSDAFLVKGIFRLLRSFHNAVNYNSNVQSTKKHKRS